MSDPVINTLAGRVDTEGNPLGMRVGKPSNPVTLGFFRRLFADGKQVLTGDSPHLYGAPTVQAPDDAADDSDRIPSTAWVRALVTAFQAGVGAVSGTLTAGRLLVGSGSSTFAAHSTLTATDVVDAVSKKHTRNADTALDTGGSNPVTAAQLVAALADIVALKLIDHAQNTDTSLDSGGSNTVTAADLKTHLNNTAIHAEIDDAGSVSSSKLWSSSKASTAIAAAITAILDATTDGTSSTKTFTQAYLTAKFGALTAPPTDADVRAIIAATLQAGGGITWTLGVDGILTPSTAGMLKVDGSVDGTGRQSFSRLAFANWAVATIASGAVTSTQTLLTIAAETGTADDLVTVNTATNGDLLILRADAGDTIALKNGTGNLLCAGGADFAITGAQLALLMRHSTGWIATFLGGAPSVGGTGDVVGPASAADGELVVFDGITGKLVKAGTTTGTGAVVRGTAPTITLPNGTGLPPGGLTFADTKRIAARKTASGGVGEECTIEELLEFIASSARGDMLVRGASSWGRVALGAAGKVWESDGIDGGWQFPKVEIAIPCSDYATNLTTGTAKATFRMPHAMTVTAVRASLSTAQSGGSALTVDINEAGTTILSTKLTFDNTEKTTTTATTPAVISDANLADDAEITVDIDTVGTAGARGLVVYLIGRRA
jgi:hypothetical protein